MKNIDYILQKKRINQAAKYISAGSTLLDIGCHKGEIFQALNSKNISGAGIDTVINKTIQKENYTLYPGKFPENFFENRKYDVITLLAVLEHIPKSELKKYPQLLKKYLNPGGKIIITIPSKIVDVILDILKFFKLIDGMDLGNHQKFDRTYIKVIFKTKNYKLLKQKRFELGFNILYVFQMQ